MGDPPETSLHEPSVHLPCLACRLKPPSRPSTGVRGRQGRTKQPEVRPVKPVVRSFHSPQSTHYHSPPLGACTVSLLHSAAFKCAPTIRLHTVLHYSETPLPQHSQSLILASQAPRTPITLSPPLSLQVTDHRPSHVLETRAVVISPSTVLPRGHVPSRAPTSTSRRKSTPPLDWDACTSTAAVLCAVWPRIARWKSCAFYSTFPNNPGSDWTRTPIYTGIDREHGDCCSRRRCAAGALATQWRT